MRKILFVILCGLLINGVFAAAPQVQLVEGKDYTVLTTPVQKTAEPKGKVNVKEFFSFTCIHCKDAEPLIEQALVPNKQADFSKIQVVWGNQAELNGYAKLNATIQALKLNKLNIPAFNAVFANQNINDPDTLKKFLAQNDLKPDEVSKFMTVYNSFSIAGQVGEYKNLTNVYNVTGTPTFVVADKYVASPAQPPRLIMVVQALIDKALKESAAKK